MAPTTLKLSIDIIGALAICCVLSISLVLGYLAIKKVFSTLKSAFLCVLATFSFQLFSLKLVLLQKYWAWLWKRQQKSLKKAIYEYDKLYSVKR